MSWLPFLTKLDNLSSEAKLPLLQGKFCSRSVAPFNIIPFEGILQFSFNCKDNQAAIVYVGLLKATFAILIEITDIWETAMYAYGMWNDDGSRSLVINKSERKLPLFTKIFCNPAYEKDIPFFLYENGKRLLGVQKTMSDVDTEEKLYNSIGDMLKLGYNLVKEIDKAHLSYSYLDVSTIIKALLHIL